MSDSFLLMKQRRKSWACRSGLVITLIASLKVFSANADDDCGGIPRTPEEAAARNDKANELKKAAAEGDVTTLERLAGEGACLHTKQWLGPSPLIEAVTHDQRAAVQWLLRAGANLEDRDPYLQEQTALMWAAANDSHDILLDLIAAGADLNARDKSGWTALIWAAVKGSSRTLDDLIAAGADLAVRDDVGWTAIIHAGYRGKAGIVDRLRAIGAPGDVRIAELVQAIRRRDIDAAKTLLAAGVDPNSKLPYGFTLLQYASGGGQTEIVAALISKGVDVNAVGASGFTALMEAADGADDRDDPEVSAYVAVASLLIRAGADVNFSIEDSESQKGQTALHRAAFSGIVGIAELLLDHGAEIEARSSYLSSTPLMYAAHSLNADMVRFLLDRGASPATATPTGSTAADEARDACQFGGDMNGVSDEERVEICRQSETLATIIEEYERRPVAR